ncbi:MAG: BTAD domain-containing putative transcriptional regulator, partial [Bacteroidota bacterium]
ALMLGDSGELIEALLFKGIISTTVAPPDFLPGSLGALPPLGFTHTLLHRQLIEHPVVDADLLVRVIADGSLYSILPFRLLAEHTWSAPLLDTATIGRAFDRTFKVQVAIRQSAQWRGTGQTWGLGVRLVACRMGSWEQDDWERILIKLVNHKLDLVRQEPVEILEQWMAYLSQLTAGTSSDEMVKGRLVLLFHQQLLHTVGSSDVTRRLWDEAEALVASRPHLRLTFPYADYVIAASVMASDNNDLEMMRRIEQRADALLAVDELPAPIRRIFERKVRPPLLKMFDTEDEFRARLARIAEFEHTIEKNEISVWKFCTDLLAEAAVVDMLERICDSTIPALREQGILVPLADSVARQASVRAGASDSFSSILIPCEAVIAALPQWRRDQVQSTIVRPLISAALLRHEPDNARDIINRYGVTDDELAPMQWILLALHTADPRGTLLAGRGNGDQNTEVASLLDLVRVNAKNIEYAAIESMLGKPVLRLIDLLTIQAVVGVIEIVRNDGTLDPLPPALADAITGALTRALEWLAVPERRLFTYMRSMLDCARPYFSARRMTAWRKRIDDLADIGSRERGNVEEGRLKLSMFGTIVACMPDGRQQRFQGARARMLLAMMVINGMLTEPLSSAEFCRLAGGGEGIEIESARDVVKTTIHRLRDMIGRDAILTDGGSPRLNPQLVDVDLLEANMLLKRAATAMRRSSPMQAKRALMAAFEITRGEVPFPSLYDDMIEAMREDFENKLRMTTIDVAEALMREGGVGDAADVLRQASIAIPGDEELAELLREALVQAGRRAEAEVAKMKSEEV